MKSLVAILILASVPSCATPRKIADRDYFRAIESVPLSSTMMQVEKLMGKPSFTQSNDGETTWGYNVTWHNTSIPKAIVWFDETGRVIEKKISLDSSNSDEMTKEEA